MVGGALGAAGTREPEGTAADSVGWFRVTPRAGFVAGERVSQADGGDCGPVGCSCRCGPIRPGKAIVALGGDARLLQRFLQGAHAHAAHLL